MCVCVCVCVTVDLRNFNGLVNQLAKVAILVNFALLKLQIVGNNAVMPEKCLGIYLGQVMPLYLVNTVLFCRVHVQNVATYYLHIDLELHIHFYPHL